MDVKESYIYVRANGGESEGEGSGTISIIGYGGVYYETAEAYRISGDIFIMMLN